MTTSLQQHITTVVVAIIIVFILIGMSRGFFQMYTKSRSRVSDVSKRLDFSVNTAKIPIRRKKTLQTYKQTL